MGEPTTSGLAALAERYDVFIFDLWGVMHNGIAAYPEALECLRQVRARGGSAALLSNAPRPGPVIREEMARLGIHPDAYDALLTSGDAAIAAYRSDPRTSGRPCYHLGPARNQATVDGCGAEERPLAEAETILCTGLFDDETETADDYAERLEDAVRRGVVMVCANPDVVVMRGERMIPCAGALAEVYEGLGGTALRFGKPYPDAYDMLLDRLPATPRQRVVMIGDGFPTDIRGAKAAGIDAVFIASGIHAEEIGLDEGGSYDAGALRALASRYGVAEPVATMPHLRW